MNYYLIITNQHNQIFITKGIDPHLVLSGSIHLYQQLNVIASSEDSFGLSDILLGIHEKSVQKITAEDFFIHMSSMRYVSDEFRDILQGSAPG